MSDIAKGAIIGVVVSILMLALLMESSGLLFGARQALPPPAAPAWTVDVIGPGGTADSAYDEGLDRAEVPGSESYAFCAITGVSIERPSMFTSNMPSGGCTIERGEGGKWLISTGTWQGCQVSCFRPATVPEDAS